MRESNQTLIYGKEFLLHFVINLFWTNVIEAVKTVHDRSGVTSYYDIFEMPYDLMVKLNYTISRKSHFTGCLSKWMLKVLYLI